MMLDEIRARLNTMPARMAERGLRQPDAYLHVAANDRLIVSLTHLPDGARTSDYSSMTGDDIHQKRDAADAWIAALPSKEETQKQEFLNQLARTIELGKDFGIADEYVNPLIAAMKRISKNAIADQRSKPHEAC